LSSYGGLVIFEKCASARASLGMRGVLTFDSGPMTAIHCRRSMLSAMDWRRQSKTSSCTPIAAKVRMSLVICSGSPERNCRGSRAGPRARHGRSGAQLGGLKPFRVALDVKFHRRQAQLHPYLTEDAISGLANGNLAGNIDWWRGSPLPGIKTVDQALSSQNVSNRTTS